MKRILLLLICLALIGYVRPKGDLMALEFDGDAGADKVVNCGNAASLDITGELTIMAGVYLPVSADRPVAVKFDYVAGGTKEGYRLLVNADDKVQLEILNSDLDIAQSAIGDTALSNGPFHIIGMYDPSTYIRVYANGAQDGENTTDIFSSIKSTTKSLLIGRETPDAWDHTFYGQIFDVRVYNRLLSEAERKIIFYSRGSDNIVDGLVGRWLLNERPDGQTADTPALIERANVDDVGAFQGVTTDGNYLWTSDAINIYKRQMDGTLISTKENAHLEGTDMVQVNHMCIHDNKIYIGSNNYDTVPKLGYVKVFNLADLSYDTEHQVLAHWSEGCAYHDNAFWVVYSDYKYVSKYNTSWEHQADYELDYPTTGDPKITGYQGITWKGEDIYCTIHDGASPSPSVDCYHWTGSTFVRKVRLTPPANADQGICYLASNDRFYIAQRHHPVIDQHSVTITEEVGNLITDISGNGNHGTPANEPVYRAAPMRLVRPVSFVPVVAEEEPPPAKKTLVQMTLI